MIQGLTITLRIDTAPLDAALRDVAEALRAADLLSISATCAALADLHDPVRTLAEAILTAAVPVAPIPTAPPPPPPPQPAPDPPGTVAQRTTQPWLSDPGATVWTEARDALMREGYPRGDTPDDLLDALNALPGPPVASYHALNVRASKLGLKRTPECIAEMQRQKVEKMRAAAVAQRARFDAETPAPAPAPPAPAPPPAVPPPEPFDLTTPSEATYAQIRAWYAAIMIGGNYDGTNIAAVNALRARRNLPPFVQIEDRLARPAASRAT